MSASEGLAALKIDRARKRTGFKVWPLIAVALVLIGAVMAPSLYRQMQGVEVSVASVKQIGGLNGVTSSGVAPLSAAGYIVADRQSVLAFKGTGLLAKLNVAEAQRVTKGQIIAEIDHRELDAHILQAEAQHAETVAAVEKAKQAVLQMQAELAANRVPVETIDAEINEIKIKLADAKRRLEDDRKAAAKNAVPMNNVEDRLTEVRAAEAQIVTAQNRREEALKRIDVMQAQLSVARSGIPLAEAAVKSAAARVQVLKEQLVDAFVYAPFDGVVTEKAAEVGEVVAPISIGGSMARGSIATIAEWSTLQAEVDVAETYIAQVKPNGRAAITIDAFPGKVFPGKVRRILPRANRSKATVQVRVDFTERNVEDGILPEMGVRVKFIPDDALPGTEKGEVKEKTAVPKSAVQGGSGAQYVWVVNDQQQAARRTVETGEIIGDDIVITKGVNPGEQVIVTGADKLEQDNQKIRLAEKAEAAGKGAAKK